MKAFHEVRNYDSDYMVWHSRYENVGFLAHWHKEIELIYVRSGSCLLSITDQTFLAHAGDLTVCESGMIHYSDSHGMDNVLDFLIFDTSILGPLFQNPGFMHPLITKAELDTFGLSGSLQISSTRFPGSWNRKSHFTRKWSVHPFRPSGRS